jgi:hypothetical protein
MNTLSEECLSKKLERTEQIRRCFTSLSKMPEWKILMTHLMEYFSALPTGINDSLSYARQCGRQDILHLLIKNSTIFGENTHA